MSDIVRRLSFAAVHAINTEQNTAVPRTPMTASNISAILSRPPVPTPGGDIENEYNGDNNQQHMETEKMMLNDQMFMDGTPGIMSKTANNNNTMFGDLSPVRLQDENQSINKVTKEEFMASYTGVVDAQRVGNLHMNMMKDHVKEEEVQERIDEEQEMVEYVEKLKFNYLELFTKQSFLETLLHEEHLRFPSNKKLEKLHEMVSGQQTELNKIIASNDQLKTEIQEVVDVAIQEHEGLQEEKDRLTELLEKFYDLMQFYENERNGEGEQVRTVEQAEEKLQEQSDKIVELNQDVAERGDELRMMECSIEPIEDEIEGLEEEIEKTLDSYEQMQAEANANADPKYVEMDAWYSGIIDAAEAMSGVQVVGFEGSELLIKCLQHDVKLFYTTEGDLEDVEVKPNDVYIKDIMEHAIEVCDTGFFVREFKNRVRNGERIQQEISEIQEEWEGVIVHWKPTATVNVFLEKKGSEAEVKVSIGQEYPEWKEGQIEIVGGFDEEGKEWNVVAEFAGLKDVVGWFME